MFAPEFGQNTWDELNIITAGANYGWPAVEDRRRRGLHEPRPAVGAQRRRPGGITHANGTLFIANLRGAVLRAVPVADPTTSTDYYRGEFGRIRDVTVTPDKQLWFVTNNTTAAATPEPTTTASSA